MWKHAVLVYSAPCLNAGISTIAECGKLSKNESPGTKKHLCTDFPPPPPPPNPYLSVNKAALLACKFWQVRENKGSPKWCVGIHPLRQSMAFLEPHRYPCTLKMFSGARWTNGIFPLNACAPAASDSFGRLSHLMLRNRMCTHAFVLIHVFVCGMHVCVCSYSCIYLFICLFIANFCVVQSCWRQFSPPTMWLSSPNHWAILPALILSIFFFWQLWLDQSETSLVVVMLSLPSENMLIHPSKGPKDQKSLCSFFGCSLLL